MIQQTSSLQGETPSPTKLFLTVLVWVSQLGFKAPCNPISEHYGQHGHRKAGQSLDGCCIPALPHAENPSATARSSSVAGTTSPHSSRGAPRAQNRSHPKSTCVQLPAGGSRSLHECFVTQAKPWQHPHILLPATAASCHTPQLQGAQQITTQCSFCRTQQLHNTLFLLPYESVASRTMFFQGRPAPII